MWVEHTLIAFERVETLGSAIIINFNVNRIIFGFYGISHFPHTWIRGWIFISFFQIHVGPNVRRRGWINITMKKPLSSRHLNGIPLLIKMLLHFSIRSETKNFFSRHLDYKCLRASRSKWFEVKLKFIKRNFLLLVFFSPLGRVCVCMQNILKMSNKSIFWCAKI